MMKQFFYRRIFIIFFLFGSLPGSAQEKTTFKASVDKNKILIGEQIDLTLEATFPSDQAIHFFSIGTIPHFEILTTEKIDTSKTETSITLKQVYHITSFDSGHWYIPAFHLDKKINTDSIPLDVVFSNFDPKQPYHDIKDIIEVNEEKQTEWLWYAIIGMVLLAGLAIFLLRRKRKAVIVHEKAVPPYEEAMLQLEKLRKGNIPLQQYYTELVNIFRLYIFRKKGIQSLQKTTDDLIVQLKEINMKKEDFERLSDSLSLSDAVKFAKYIPAAEDNKIAFENIKRSIESIEHLKENEGLV